MNKEISIALITPWHRRCGIASYSENLAKALADLGVDVHVVRLHRFSTKDKEYYEDLATKIPIDKVELVHCQHEYGLFQGKESTFYSYLKALGKPIVTTAHATGVPGLWLTDRLISTLSDRVIVHNEFCASKFGFPSVIIPHGATPTRPMDRGRARRMLKIPHDGGMVGYCGFLSPTKGLEDLIEAVSKVKGVGLMVGGGWHVVGTEADEYRVQLEQAALKLLKKRHGFLDYVPDEDLGMLYGAVDLVVYPARNMSESGALIMALSHGKACIARDLDPVKEREELGVLATFSDVKELARKIRYLLKHGEERERLEQAAKRYTEETSWRNVAGRHIELYRELVK